MANFPSRRALFAFARAVSGNTGTYQCPICARHGSALQNPSSRPNWSGTRRFGGGAVRKSEEKEDSEDDQFGDDLLKFQLSSRRLDGTRVAVPPVEVNQDVEKSRSRSARS